VSRSAAMGQIEPGAQGRIEHRAVLARADDPVVRLDAYRMLTSFH
jgi:hypothetical protein